MKKISKYIVPVALAAILVYFAFKGVDFKVLSDTFSTAKLSWVGLAMIFCFVAYIIRALRWNMLLEPLGYKASHINLVAAVAIGYLINLVFPRAGELARAASLQKTDKIPIEVSFGAVVTERLIDVLVLLILFIANIFIEYSRLGKFLEEFFPDFQYSTLFFFVAIAIIGLVLYFFKNIKSWIISVISKIVFFQKISKMLEGFGKGLLSVAKIKNVGLFIFYSFCLWACYYILTYALIKATTWGDMISWRANLSVLVIGSVGMAIPTLGGLGSYHILVSKILEQYAFTAEQGIAIATFSHTYNGLFFVVVFGFIGILYSFLFTKTID